MPAQGRGANLDTSRRVGAPRGEGPSVRQQAASKAVPSYRPSSSPPEDTSGKRAAVNRAFGPGPNRAQGENEGYRPLRTPSFHPTSKSGGKRWVGDEVVRPAVKYGGTEAPQPIEPEDPNRRQGTRRTPKYRPGETPA